MVRSGVLVLLVTLLAASSAGQETPSAPVLRDQVEVTIGTVDVSVSDAEGRPVNGLTRADFALLVNGVSRPLTHFAAFESTGTAGEAPPISAPAWDADTPERTPLAMAILVDNENLSIFNRNHAVKRLADFARATLRPPDRAVVVVNDKYLRFLGGLTSDPEEVAAHLDGLLTSSSGVGAVQSFRRIAEQQIWDISQEGSNIPLDQKIDRSKMSARVNAAQLESSLRLTLSTMKDLIRMLAGVPGKRVVVYVSDGLPMSPGLEIYYLITQLFQARIGETGLGAIDASPLFSEVISYAAAAEVTIFAVDARGLDLPSGREAENRSRLSGGRSGSDQASDVGVVTLRNYQDPLILMSTQTGGQAIVNTNKVAEGLERIGQSLTSYYSLGFELEPAAGDQVHRVQVGLAGREDVRLRYRPTLVQRTLATRVADRTVAALGFALADNPLGIEVGAGAATAVDRKRRRVPVKVQVPLERVAMVPDGDALVGSLTMYYVAAGATGRRSEVARHHQPLRIPAAARGRVKHLALEIEVEIGEGDHTVSVGVLDETGAQAGYAVVRVAGAGR